MWTVEAVRTKLESDDWWVYRALEALHERPDEPGKGFNAVDTKVAAKYIGWIREWRDGSGYPKPIGKRHTVLARKMILKYSRQLADLANQR